MSERTLQAATPTNSDVLAILRDTRQELADAFTLLEGLPDNATAADRDRVYDGARLKINRVLRACETASKDLLQATRKADSELTAAIEAARLNTVVAP